MTNVDFYLVVNELYQIHMSLKFNCEECQKEFETKNKLRWHKMNTHQGQVQCDVCCKFFSTMNNLERHKNNVHDKCSVSCENCNKSFRPDNLKRHHKVQFVNHKQSTYYFLSYSRSHLQNRKRTRRRQ